TVSIRVKVSGKVYQASGSGNGNGNGNGNGGYDAFIFAINKVLTKIAYTLPTLIDFEVRIPKGGNTNALTESIITWDCGDYEFKTRGVHSNQVFAAIAATLRIINLQLHEREKKQ
ncbi:MAG: 2-isopropylmalate synthase, partial [Gammaproteobacteria bacterium]|nr:2-isopropylmalate synthase [Gammaproteobacteria bacterium]